MQNLKNILPHRRAIAALFTLGLICSVIGLWSGRNARLEVRALGERLRGTERNLSTRLDRLYADLLPDNTRKYVIRTHEGKIGIFNEDESVLYEILDVDIRTLPSADRAQLDAGIVVNGEAALRAITEDYCS